MPPERTEVPEEAKQAGLTALNALLSGSLVENWPSHERSVEVILEGALPKLHDHWLSQLSECLLGDQDVMRIAGKAAYEDFDPTGDWDLLEEPLRMTWEGNTAAGIEAALQAWTGKEGEDAPR